MDFSRLNKRGQTSIEFLFLFLIMLIYVNTIVYPNMNISRAYIEETHRVGQARLAIKQIANAVTEVAASSGESKQTLYVFLDSNTELICDETNNKIRFEVKMNNQTNTGGPGSADNECSGDVCYGVEIVSLPVGTTLDCSNFPVIKSSEIKKAKILVSKDYLGGAAVVHVQAAIP